MKRPNASFALIVMLALTLAPLVTAADDAASTQIMGEPHDRTIGGWREIGRIERGDAMGHLTTLGDGLVAVGTVCGPTEADGCEDVGWHSDDGMTWTPATIPGSAPVVTDVTFTSNRVIAVGYTLDGGPKGAIWSTRDGVVWTQLLAPPVPEIDWVAATDDAIVVSAGYRLWMSADSTEWRRLEGPRGAGLLAGSGGFLASSGGGQDLVSPTELWHSPDGSEWTKVKLPRALRKGHDAAGGVQVFALTDRWLLVPEAEKSPKSIFTSTDGRQWQRVPRPRGMTQGWVWWIDDIGELTQAFGWLPERRKQPNGIWTWREGEKAAKPMVWRKDTIGRPVEWDGERIALGEAEGDPSTVTLWRWELTAEEMQLIRGPL